MADLKSKKSHTEVTKAQLKAAIETHEDNMYSHSSDFFGSQATNIRIRNAKSAGIEYTDNKLKDNDKVVMFTGKLLFDGHTEIYYDCYYSLEILLKIIKNYKIKQ